MNAGSCAKTAAVGTCSGIRCRPCKRQLPTQRQTFAANSKTPESRHSWQQSTVARYVEMPRQHPLAHTLAARHPELPVKFHGVYLLVLPAAARREKWTTFTPLATPVWRRYRGLILHRRSQQDVNHRWERLIVEAGYVGSTRLFNFYRSALALDAAIEGHRGPSHRPSWWKTMFAPSVSSRYGTAPMHRVNSSSSRGPAADRNEIFEPFAALDGSKWGLSNFVMV